MSSSAASTSRDTEPAASAFLHSLAAIIVLVAAASPLHAQSYIFGRADFAVGNTPSSVAVGDFNHDGVMDLVVTNSLEGDNTVSILLGKPDGTFNPQVRVPVGVTPISVVVADFNGDGILDIATLNGNCVRNILGETCSDGWISVLLGKGDGTFLPAVSYAVGSAGGRSITLLVADLNGDGLPDLVATNGEDRTISVLLNNGVGGFQNQVAYSVPNGALGAAIGDFNGDHKLDIAVGGSTMSVLLGNGDGTFQAPVTSGIGGVSMAVADYNHDGKLDLVVTGSGSRTAVMLGNGDGTFTAISTSPSAAAVYTADLNGDGKPDLILISVSGNYAASLTVEFGNGDGTFQPGVSYGSGGGSPAVLTDINGDGRLDVVSVIPAQNVVSVFLGLGGGVFPTFTDYFSGQFSIVAADFNGDQKPDLAAILNSTIQVILNNGDGSFGSSHPTPLNQNADAMIAGDFNNDHQQDVAVLYENCNNGCQAGQVAVFLGNGNATFQTPKLSTVGLQPYALAAGDFNHDGNLDLVVANNGANTISVLLGNGDGTFQTHVDYGTTANPVFVAVADLNGDGIPDIVVVDTGFSIFFGNGDGTFQSRVDNTTTGGNQVVIGDFNGDGIPDLCFQYAGAFVVLLGNGDGTFQAPLRSYFGIGTGPFAGADFNDDGKLDLVMLAGGQALLGLGRGDGTFGSLMSYIASDGTGSSVVTTDLNGDGVPDLASVFGNNNTISVLLSASFKAVSPSALNFGSQGVTTTSAPQILTVTNSSNVKITIASVVTAAPFSQTNDCGGILEPGASCTASVTFTPSSTGLDSGALTITDSTRNSPTRVPLSGTGVSGGFLTPIPASLAFQPQSVGASSNPVPVTLKNTGNANLTITSIGISGLNSSDYTQTNNCPGSLPAGQNCTANVTFTPTTGGVRSANLSIADNAPGSPQTVPLSGLGLAEENTLTVTVIGSGGRVNSTDGLIHCPEVCSHVYPANAQVTLTATADQYWRFFGWNGNCPGNGTCTLTMTQNMSATATFQYTYFGLEFVPIAPCRVADTRWPNGPFGGPALQGHNTRNYQLAASACSIPQSAFAFSLNMTVVPHGYLGYLTIFPGSDQQPVVSTMNSLDGRIKANAVIVAAGSHTDVNVYVSDTTDAVMDIDGYFQNGGNAEGFYPLPPCRVVDTRRGNGDLGGPFLTGGVERDFPLLESSCIPQGISPQAYSLNVTVVPHTAGQPLSYLTVWPQGQSKPLVSTLNNLTATIVANAAVVVAGPTGAIATYPSNDTDLVVDINGYFASYQQGALLFYPLYPCRVLDTRQGSGAFSGLLSPPVDVIDNPCGANSTAQAYVFNATVVPSPSLSYLTLWPDGQNQPVVSTLNAADGWIASNMAIVPTSNGSIDAYAAGMTQLILDISGYFAP